MVSPPPRRAGRRAPFSITAGAPERGEQVQVTVGDEPFATAEVEDVAADGRILWTSGSCALQRTLFLRTGEDTWTSR